MNESSSKASTRRGVLVDALRIGGYLGVMDAPTFSHLTHPQFTAIQMNLAKAAEWAGVDRTPDAAKVQEIYDALLEHEISDPDRLITLGVAFGQLLIDRAGLEWVSVTDKHGTEICVAVPAKQSFCAPLSMMGKRIDRAEPLSIEQLCEDTLALLRERSSQPGVGTR